MLSRRYFIALTGGASALLASSLIFAKEGSALGLFDKKESKSTFPYTLTDAEWKKKLTDEEYYVLRGHGTEPARSSILNEEKRNGTYVCAGCAHELYASAHKFESGTGWPSFYQPIKAEGAVGTSKDYKLIIPRTEVHCANCGGHLGHVFDDGPQPTGLRYCMNGVAMDFIPA